MRRHEHLFAAMLEARADQRRPCASMWDADRQSFVEPLAEMIRAERAAGTRAGRSRPDRPRDGAARAQRPGPRARSCAVARLDRDEQVEAVTDRLAAHDLRDRGMSEPMKYDELDLPLRRRRVLRGWHFTGAATPSPPTAGRPGRGDGARPRRHQGLRAGAVRARRWPRPGSTSSPSTTAASAPARLRRDRRSAMAGQVEDYRAAMAAAARAARASTRAGSCSGASRCPADTSSRPPPTAPTSPPSCR